MFAQLALCFASHERLSTPIYLDKPLTAVVNEAVEIAKLRKKKEKLVNSPSPILRESLPILPVSSVRTSVILSLLPVWLALGFRKSMEKSERKRFLKVY